VAKGLGMQIEMARSAILACLPLSFKVFMFTFSPSIHFFSVTHSGTKQYFDQSCRAQSFI